MTALIVFLSSLGAASAACPAGVSSVSTDLTNAVEAGWAAFANLDERNFDASTKRAYDAVPCLSQVVAEPDAAALHTATGVRAFLDENDAVSIASFRAARSAFKADLLPDEVAPPGGPLDQLWQRSNLAESRLKEDVPVPSGATAYIDGRPSPSRPLDQPAIVQVATPDGAVQWSRYLQAGDPLPVDIVAASLARAPDPRSGGSSSRGSTSRTVSSSSSTPSSRGSSTSRTSPQAGSALSPSDAPPPREPRAPRERKARAPWTGLAVGSGIVAAGLYGAAAGLRLSYDNNPSQLTHTGTNGAYWGSVGASVLTVGFGAAAVFGGGD